MSTQTTSVDFAGFEGAWQLERMINEATGAQYRFDGKALWSRDGENLVYHETGHLFGTAPQPIKAERQYLWKPDMTVWFGDGRFFHQVPHQGGKTAHWCDPDQYDGQYDFSRWPTGFCVHWVVRGPRKDYTMTSDYHRN